MSGSALKVYVIIKTLSGFENGKTTASQQTIADQSGLSVIQVKRAVKELKFLGYLFSERFGRKNTIKLLKKFPLYISQEHRTLLQKFHIKEVPFNL